MKPLVGLGLSGPSVTMRNSRAARGVLGAPTWGPGELLRDLELRLAVPDRSLPRSVRVPRYAARIAALAETSAFYAASFASDAMGTSDTLLAWRDDLVEAGWNGAPVPDGGERLAAIARLEAVPEPVPHGDADRLAGVLSALRASPPIYEEITLVEERSSWSGGWERIFSALESAGTKISMHRAELPGARASTDLGILHDLLRREPRAADSALPERVRGDGSLMVVRGETPTQLAALAAALLGKRSEDTVVVRSGDASPLEAALAFYGLPAQGLTSASAWRPAMQVLPLAVEVAFEPRDPHRALELLTLSVGPFRGIIGSRLARAVARSPGIGGREWEKRRDEARELLAARETKRRMEEGASDEEAAAAAHVYVTARLQRVAEWLEGPVVSPDGAPAAAIRQVAERVRAFLLNRMDEEPEIYGPAFAQAHAFVEALSNDARETLSREATRQILDTLVRSSHDHPRSVERAGRIDHVRHPSAVLRPCATIMFWSFDSSAERRPKVLPWNHAERTALRAAGVSLTLPETAIQLESGAWRGAVLAARDRAIFVIPASTGRDPVAAHSLWDEISARLRLDGPANERLTWHARDVLDGRRPLVSVERLEPLALPEARPFWTLSAGIVRVRDESDDGATASATSLETFVTCPLRWILEERADLRTGAVAAVSAGAQLSGTLGHRLVEELFAAGAFDEPEATFHARASTILQSLIQREAASLLLPGMSFEHAQLVPQLLRAARDLRRYLERSGFRIAAVEEIVEVASCIGALSGRLDVRLTNDAGTPAVLDLKWGEARYRDVVAQGRAIQLAAYARAVGESHASASDGVPPAGYFALRSGRVLTADARMNALRTMDGSTLDLTWSRVERTALEVERSISAGKIPVTGTQRSLPLLDALTIEDGARAGCYEPKPEAACTYCSCAPLCGRAWERFH